MKKESESTPRAGKKETKVRKADVPEPKSKTFNQPKRAFIDVIRRGGRRRGYIVIVPKPDSRIAVGYSLCETKDRFNGSTGLEIAFKRADRWEGKESVVLASNGHGHSTPEDAILKSAFNTVSVPCSIAERIVSDITKYFSMHVSDDLQSGCVLTPGWVEDLEQLIYGSNIRFRIGLNPRYERRYECGRQHQLHRCM